MHGPSHLLLSWFLAEGAGLDFPRDRRLVALSGLALDIDALAYIGAIAWYGFDKDQAFTNVWQPLHHRYTHGMGFILLTGILTYLLMRRYKDAESPTAAADPGRAMRVALLAMAASMTHVFFDLVAGGPTWPVYPFWPLSDQPWSVAWSYTLADWPNILILLGCLMAMFWFPRYADYSPLEAINYRLDRWFVQVVQQGSDTGAAGDNGGLLLRIVIYVSLLLLVAAILIPLGLDSG